MTGKFKIKYTSRLINNRSIQAGGRAEKAMANQVLQKSEAYIPKDTGDTIKSGKYKDGAVVYDTPYARDIYYSTKNYNESPQRGAKWFERMKTDRKMEILSAIAKVVGSKGGRRSWR